MSTAPSQREVAGGPGHLPALEAAADRLALLEPRLLRLGRAFSTAVAVLPRTFPPVCGDLNDHTER